MCATPGFPMTVCHVSGPTQNHGGAEQGCGFNKWGRQNRLGWGQSAEWAWRPPRNVVVCITGCVMMQAQCCGHLLRQLP